MNWSFRRIAIPRNENIPHISYVSLLEIHRQGRPALLEAMCIGHEHRKELSDLLSSLFDFDDLSNHAQDFQHSPIEQQFFLNILQG